MAKLLIVDDEKSICEEFRNILTEEDHEVDIAWNGKEALQKVRQTSYDLIFLDVLMPHMEGREVFEAMMQIRPMAVAIMSGYMPPNKEREVLAMGAVACLRKPLELDRIKALIRSVSEKNAAS